MVNYLVKRIEEEVRNTLNYLESDEAPISKVGFAEVSLKEIIRIISDYNKKTIGETTVRWISDDIVNDFSERFNREPTKEELEDIIENYIDLEDKGVDYCTQIGWEHIYSALKDWEKDNPQETNNEDQ